MKHLYLFFIPFLLFFLLQCNAVDSNIDIISQIVAGEDSLISDSLKALFKEDAARLTLRDIYLDQTKKDSLIILPKNIVESYYRGFIHIYNAESLDARDSVLVNYKIHALHYPRTHFIEVTFDSTKPWAKEWKNGQRITGDQQIDFLMTTYNIQLKKYYSFPWYHAAKLFSEEPLNIFALSKRFEPIDGIIYAHPMALAGEGSDIMGIIESDYISYLFSYGWGDCLEGCLHRHYWSFQVRFDGTVLFVNSYGDPL